MAEPARDSAAHQGQAADAVPKPDPRGPVWADVRRAIIAGSGAVALAAAQVAARPGDADAVAGLSLARQVMESLAEIGRRWVLDEKAVEAERAQAYAEGAEACRAARGRLRVIGGG